MNDYIAGTYVVEDEELTKEDILFRIYVFRS